MSGRFEKASWTVLAREDRGTKWVISYPTKSIMASTHGFANMLCVSSR